MLPPCAVVELVWRDSSGSTSATTVFAPSDLTYSEIDASASALASILLPLTGCVLVEQRIKYKVVPDTPSAASGGASVLRTGAFFFSTAEDDPMALVIVRAIKASLVAVTEPGAGVSIDTDNVDVIAFVDAVIEGGFTNVFSDDITAFDTAYMQSRV